MNEIQNLSWAVVHAEASKKLESCRKRNDDIKLSPEETAALRGEIRALKWLLNDLPDQVLQKLQMPPPGQPGSEQF